jgi:dipeptidyl aminopeptidase/acylaminoacyl peptidase
MDRCALLCACLFLFILPAVVFAESKRPMMVEDLFKLKRLTDAQVSPDGKTVTYVITTVDLAGNKTSAALWLAPTEKGEPRQLTNSGKKDRAPRWSPDSKQILFESNRSGENQLWLIDLAGGEARQVTSLNTEAHDAAWSQDGKSIAFVSSVYPEYSDKPFTESDSLNKKRKEEAEKNPVKAKVFTKLFYRHWDSYVEDKRQHLFVLSVPAAGAAIPEPRDVTPGDRDAYPTATTFSSAVNFTFSPDGHYLVYTAPPERDEAWSTNYDLFRVPVAGGERECLTKDNPAADSGAQFSPDGKHLVYRAQRRSGYEADRWELMVVETDLSGAFQGKPRSLTKDLDRGIHEFLWLDKDTVLFNYEEDGHGAARTVSLRTGKLAPFDLGSPAGYFSGLTVSKGPDPVIGYLRASMSGPNEAYVLSANGSKARNVSQANTAQLAQLDLPRPESVKVKVEGGDMQMWILKPPGFDPAKMWPLVYLVHGGPQGAWEDAWSYRWNPEVWAAQGYVVVLPNPRGSTGFGQKFVDEISGDWGGKCYDDLMKGVDYLERLPYIDRDRIASAGASFGGYMMNWFQGKTTRFKTLITHCGVYNFDSMYATTEELWFDEWEHGGPPWGTNRASYEKHSPHRLAKNFKTPMLIIHNDLDFRVPVSEGQQLFTTLQRLKVPSRFINFPDEGHWVLKPANSAYWHREVFAWLTKYVPPGGK